MSEAAARRMAALYVSAACASRLAYEARADVGEVRAHGLRSEDGVARGDGTRQRDRPVEDAPHLAHQRERRQRTGMATRAGGHQDQPVDPRLQRLLGVAQVDHVVQHDAAVAVHRVENLPDRRAQRGDEDRHLVLDAGGHVLLQPRVGDVHDLVDRQRPDHGVRMRGAVGGEVGLDLREPVVQHFGGARVERRERAHDAGLALRQHQLRIADDEHRRADHRQRQVLQHGWQVLGGGHGVSWQVGADGGVRFRL